jgi:hypothetical protein
LMVVYYQCRHIISGSANVKAFASTSLAPTCHQ